MSLFGLTDGQPMAALPDFRQRVAAAGFAADYVVDATWDAAAREVHVLCGTRGGELADVAILIPSTVTSHIQESHLAVGHILCELIERLACGRKGD